MLKKSQIRFIVYTLGISLILFLMLYSLGLVPEAIKPETEETYRTLWDKTQSQNIADQQNKPYLDKSAEQPTRIQIQEIGVDVSIANPNSTDVKVLDDYLLRGVVRYPGSGLVGAGNMFIFGHSTGYTVVQNQAFKAFNGLKNLQAGDQIFVYSSSGKHEYRVSSVRLVDETQALVEFGGNGFD